MNIEAVFNCTGVAGGLRGSKEDRCRLVRGVLLICSFHRWEAEVVLSLNDYVVKVKSQTLSSADGEIEETVDVREQ